MAKDRFAFQFSGLDRAAALRPDWQTQLQHPQALCLPIWRGKPLIQETGAYAADLVWVSPQASALSGAQGLPVFLGLSNGQPRFTQDMSHWEPVDQDEAALDTFLDPSRQRHPDFRDESFFGELRGVMTWLSPAEAELASTARALTQWHARHGFCANCGAKSDMTMAGWQRDCPSCGASHYPRTDPVVIMLITHGNSVLVGRSPGWPEKMYSLLAGFVEPGESPEAAVRREVFEEAGVHVGRVDYLASQPWPFPASLMTAWSGVATSTDIHVDPEELEHARWVSREEMAQVFRGEHPEINAARRGAIARSVLYHWMADSLDSLPHDGAPPCT